MEDEQIKYKCMIGYNGQRNKAVSLDKKEIFMSFI